MVDKSKVPEKRKWYPGQQRPGPSAPGVEKYFHKNLLSPRKSENKCLNFSSYSLGRDEAISLCKRYGGRVTTLPSSKTSYVVLGSDAGPKKLEAIKKHKIKTLNEDEFLELISTRSAGSVDPKTLKKQEDEVKKVEELAKSIGPPKSSLNEKEIAGQLWTVKYAPKTLSELCGNKAQIERLQTWLKDWHKNRKANFSKPGKDGLGLYRAVVISGPPGVGKTTAAHLIAQVEGFEILELNASDTRSKKLLEVGYKDVTSNTSIAGFFQTSTQRSEKLVLIMDEVDGMSAGDRGGVGALNVLIRKTQVPIIAIANDMSLPKMRPLKSTAHSIVFRRPDANTIRSRMMSIAFREGMKIPGNAIDELVAGSQSDIRLVINMLSTWKLGNQSSATKTMNFDEARKLAQANEKNTIVSPWSLTSKLFAPQTWSQNSSMTLMDKCDLYFQDHDMLPLFVQDGYVKHEYGLARTFDAKEKSAKKMELLSKAADSITDGDMVDRLIHGPQQHWSLMPLHGVFSCVRPAYYCHGPSTSTGYPGGGFSFPAWFGKNSTQTKLNRLLSEVQMRMKLKISADKREVLMSYLPILYPRLFDPLLNKKDGADGVTEVIELMDDYYLTKDEWDSIVELMALGKSAEEVLKKIPSASKSAFTRKYNKMSHPIPFHKDVDIQPSKKLKVDNVPDLEDLVEVETEAEEEEEEEDNLANDISKDKLIKPKKNSSTTPSSNAKNANSNGNSSGKDVKRNLKNGSGGTKRKK
ncbi:replication factor C subunit 1 [Phakopsora pachyrhizi]|nr:replication factor C subunit 1 [Phakopsora pachyrhizi]